MEQQPPVSIWATDPKGAPELDTDGPLFLSCGAGVGKSVPLVKKVRELLDNGAAIVVVQDAKASGVNDIDFRDMFTTPIGGADTET